MQTSVCKRLVVATDDQRILEHVQSPAPYYRRAPQGRACDLTLGFLQQVKGFGGDAVMTHSLWRSGTERIFEAWRRIVETDGNVYDVVINVQGDEPLLNPDHVNALAELMTSVRLAHNLCCLLTKAHFPC